MRAAIVAAISLALGSAALAATGLDEAAARKAGGVVLAQDAAPDGNAADDNAGGDNSTDAGEEGEGGVMADENAFPENFKFERIPVTFPPSADAPGLTDFLKSLQVTVQTRDEPALMKAVAPKIFWDRDFGDSFDAAQNGEANFRQAMQIGVPDLDPSYSDEGWKRLSAMLATTRISTEAGHPGAYCLPAFPALADKTAADKVFAAAGMEQDEWQLAWGYVDGKVEVVDKLGPGAQPVGVLEDEATPVLTWAADDDMNWAEVGLPDGKSGFVRNHVLGSWVNERLCVGKTEADEWAIVGYVGGGD